MSHQLAAIAYADLATAERVREELVDATREGRTQLEDAGGIVVHSSLSTSDERRLQAALAEGAATVRGST